MSQDLRRDEDALRVLTRCGGAALLLGVLYYLVFRGATLPAPLAALPSLPEALAPRDPSGGSFPSLVHAFVTVVLLVRLGIGGRTGSHVLLPVLSLPPLLWLETRHGTPDALDALAIVAGVVGALALARRLDVAAVRRRPRRGRLAGVLGAPLALGVSALLALGSYAEDPGCALYDERGACLESKRWGHPVYMSYARLRESVAVEPARPLDDVGGLYLYGDYLFVNERNRGIHVFDNREPTEPVPLGFIRVPGNTEIAIRGDHLYADSYVDLVTLDLADPANVREVDRKVDVFPYDAFQSVPYFIAFRWNELDAARGVVVSYEE